MGYRGGPLASIRDSIPAQSSPWVWWPMSLPRRPSARTSTSESTSWDTPPHTRNFRCAGGGEGSGTLLPGSGAPDAKGGRWAVRILALFPRSEQAASILGVLGANRRPQTLACLPLPLAAPRLSMTPGDRLPVTSRALQGFVGLDPKGLHLCPGRSVILPRPESVAALCFLLSRHRV